MWNLFGKKQIVPEALWAYRSKLPKELDVDIAESEDGGFVAVVKNIPGCMTQGDSIEKLNEMINFAVYDHLSIPEEYFPYVNSYLPPPELRVGEELVFRAA